MRLLVVSTQAPLQSVCPAAQPPLTHALLWQICPLAQARPQPPQWRALLAGSAQNPLQSTMGDTQVRVHAPA
jgi:hypothetical protein